MLVEGRIADIPKTPRSEVNGGMHKDIFQPLGLYGPVRHHAHPSVSYPLLTRAMASSIISFLKSSLQSISHPGWAAGMPTCAWTRSHESDWSPYAC